MTITYKDAAEIRAMRTACRLASEVLDYLTPHIQPGITTREIDRLAADYMKEQGTTSATLGYQLPDPTAAVSYDTWPISGTDFSTFIFTRCRSARFSATQAPTNGMNTGAPP